jgi:hypothetical protein
MTEKPVLRSIAPQLAPTCCLLKPVDAERWP